METIPVGPLKTNCYLCSCGTEAILIDCGSNPAPIAESIANRQLNLRAMYLTHLHLDHVGGVATIQAMTGAEVYASKNDGYLADVPFDKGGARELGRLANFEFQDIAPGRHIALSQPMIVLDTPGHTLGSLSYFFPMSGCVFVGDLIFMLSVGRTDFPGGESKTLLKSIENRIFILPGQTRIYPGHGPMTTVEHEKRNSPFFKTK